MHYLAIVVAAELSGTLDVHHLGVGEAKHGQNVGDVVVASGGELEGADQPMIHRTADIVEQLKHFDAFLNWKIESPLRDPRCHQKPNNRRHEIVDRLRVNSGTFERYTADRRQVRAFDGCRRELPDETSMRRPPPPIYNFVTIGYPEALYELVKLT
jgi:hypothetical protein